MRENIAPKAVKADETVVSRTDNATEGVVSKPNNTNEAVKVTQREDVKVNNNSNVSSDNARVEKNDKKENLREMINDSSVANGILEILENNSFGFFKM